MASTPVDLFVHNSYFIVAHIHYVLFLSSLFGIYSATYFWYPKMFGRYLNNTLGYIHFWVTLLGAYLIFWPMHYEGLAGMPRRYFDFSIWESFKQFAELNRFISTVAMIVFAVQLLFLFNFFYSIFKGRKVTVQNPWESNTLEWTTPIRPGHGNWPGEIPEVYRWPYDYSKPGSKEDFIPQNIPYSETPESNLPHENELIKLEMGDGAIVVEKEKPRTRWLDRHQIYGTAECNKSAIVQSYQ